METIVHENKNLELDIAKALVEKGFMRSKEEAIDMVRDVVDRFENSLDEGDTFERAESRLAENGYQNQEKAIAYVAEKWGIKEWDWAHFNYEVWLLGENEDETCNDLERLEGSFDSETEAVRYADTREFKPLDCPITMCRVEFVKHSKVGDECVDVVYEREL